MAAIQKNEWAIKELQNRYKGLCNIDLDEAQAKEVISFEKDKGFNSPKCYFSTWEEFDYDLTSFKKILTDKQFTGFQKHHKRMAENYGKDLIAQDKGNLIEIEFHKEAIKFYKEKFLPGFFSDPVLCSFIWLNEDKAKIDLLKAEYKKFLTDVKKELLITHFRNYRTYMPNELEVVLLRHKLNYMWPTYSSFKYRMDEPTRAVTAYLKQKLNYFQEKYDDFIKDRLETLKIFNQNNFIKYHPERQGGWNTVIAQLSPDDEKEARIMSLLLLDRDQYNA